MVARVFISYSSKDSKVARTICAALESRGQACWIASRDVPPGGNFMDAIVKAINAAQIMVLVFSENANNSEEIKRELVLASEAKVTVIPVRVEDVKPKGAFAYQLATRQWIDLFGDWESEVERLAEWIDRIVPTATATPPPIPKPETEAELVSGTVGTSLPIDGRREDEAKRRAEEEAQQRDRNEAEERRNAKKRAEGEQRREHETAHKRQQNVATRLPWRPSRRTIIAGASVCGAGALATVIGVAVRRNPANPVTTETTPVGGPAPPTAAGSNFLIRTFTGHTATVTSLAIAADGHAALSGSNDTTVRLWDLADGSTIRTFTAHTGGIWSVAFVPGGRTALSASGHGNGIVDDTLRLWDLANGSTIRTLTGDNPFLSIAVAPDGHTAISSVHTTLRLWDLANGRVIRTFTGHTESVYSVVISPDGGTALSGSYDTTLRLWDLATGNTIRTLTGHTAGVRSVAIVPAGRFALSGSDDKTLRLWDLDTGNTIRTFTGHTAGVYSVAIAPDGRTALSGGGDRILRLWDLVTGNAIRTFTGHASWISSVAIAPDGRTALSGSDDKTLKLWSLS